MNYYQYHLFFCINQRSKGKACCADHDAEGLSKFAKRYIKSLGLKGPGKARVTRSGCLGRCSEGPCLLIYPDGIWYNYASEDDIKTIIDQHVCQGRQVKDLIIP